MDMKKMMKQAQKMQRDAAAAQQEIAAMMTLLNDFYKKGSITRGELKTLIILLNPVAPHITRHPCAACLRK